MDSELIEIIAILILIAANGFFSLSEFSIIASRKSKLKHMIDSGVPSADRALHIKSHPESFLATVQIGITCVGVLAGVFSGMTIVGSMQPIIAKIPIPIIAKSSQPIAFFLVVAIISGLTIVIGELIPKYLALSSPENIAVKIARPMSLFSKISYFAVQSLNGMSKLILRLLGLKKLPERSSVSEDEIDLIIAEGKEKGLFDATEQELIHSVFDFADTTARQTMTPRTDIVSINIDDDPDRILERITKHGFSRYPVYAESIDKVDGIIYAKDIIKLIQESRLSNLHDIIRKPLFVPDSMKLSTLLPIFQQKKVHVAIVLDEFGGTAGLITLEDLLEEIVGEIQDEHDHEQREFIKDSETVAFASASFRVDELNDDFGTDLPEDGPDTLGGLIFEHLQRPANQGEVVIIDSLRFEILEVDGNRIKRMKIEKLESERPSSPLN